MVGDRVSCVDSVIDEVLPRKNFLARLRGDRQRRSHIGYEQQIIVANLDLAVIVAAAKSPAFHPKFIDRYLVVCQSGGVPAAICLNKSDLAGDPPSLSIYENLGIPVVRTSAANGTGIAALQQFIMGKTVAFVGTSGVGKSSLANALLPDANIKANAISTKTDKGRHTTTSSSFYEWAPNSYLIDTPGIRALGLENMDKESLQYYFPEFEPFVGTCKFNNCSHLHEPGCAVKQALENQQISEGRYESYARMMGE